MSEPLTTVYMRRYRSLARSDHRSVPRWHDALSAPFEKRSLLKVVSDILQCYGNHLIDMPMQIEIHLFDNGKGIGAGAER